MGSIKRAKPSPALVVAVVALVAALAGGAVAGVAVTALDKKERKQVRKIARKLDKKIELTPGPQGERGEQGPAGPSTGPAGGSLKGFFPNPDLAQGSVGPSELADDAVTAAAVAPNSLGGDEINESDLDGVDRSAESGSFSGGPGGSSTAAIGGGLSLRKRCTGSAAAGNGLELDLINNSGFTRSLLARVITDGGAVQVSRTSVGNGSTTTVVDIPESMTDSLHHWITLLIPQIKQTRELIVRTRQFGSNSCGGDEFRTITTG